MWWWKKKIADQAQWADGAALRIFKGYRFLQSRWVKFMERQVRRWSVRKQKILFVFMTVIAAVYFLDWYITVSRGKG